VLKDSIGQGFNASAAASHRLHRSLDIFPWRHFVEQSAGFGAHWDADAGHISLATPGPGRTRAGFLSPAASAWPDGRTAPSPARPRLSGRRSPAAGRLDGWTPRPLIVPRSSSA